MLTILILIASAPALADVRLPAIFASNMVLQQQKEIPIWGWAEPGEEVSVSFIDREASTKADKDGNWMVRLKHVEAGGPYVMVISGNNRIELVNIMAGEVWVCSGQSNMDWTVERAINAKEEIAAANYPNIRLFAVTRDTSGTPVNDCAGNWTMCSPETISKFSAVAYFFGRHLNKELDVPIGLIKTAWGGTRIEPWTPITGFKSVPELKDISDEIAQADIEYNNAVADSLDTIEQWVQNTRVAIKANKPFPPNPGFPRHSLNSNRKPTGLFNAMVNPIVPYGIRGAIWYQGESNREDGLGYFPKMQALINGWRKVWNQGDFPFYIVQLAPFKYRGDPLLLPQIWETQTNILSLKNTGVAVTVDIGNTKDIHPKNKQDVGKRLALWALAKDYGKTDIVHSGPLYKSMKIKKDKILIRFDHVGGGLVSRDGNDLNWFEIAGEDKIFVKAKAQIKGKKIIVSSDHVKKPVSVRFAWHQEAEPNLSNKEGLPASPFRTDKW
jgi:sialate O-acetylesterase